MSKIKVNDKEITRVFSGDREIYNIYKGNNQLWQNFNAVDLGLPSGTLWADRNLGATTSYEYGGVYSWGDLNSTVDDWDHYMCSSSECGGVNDELANSGIIYKDQDDEWFGDISGREMDATHNSGNDYWRMPTTEEFNELTEYCTINCYYKFNNDDTIEYNSYATIVGPNGNSIVLPFSDKYEDGFDNPERYPLNTYKRMVNNVSYTVTTLGQRGYYWTGTINSGNVKQAFSIVAKDPDSGSGTYDKSSFYEAVTSRYRHLAIRPVYAHKPDEATITLETNSMTMYQGESKSIYFEISPELSTDKKVHFVSSNTSRATVTNTGFITLSKWATVGSTVDITAYLNNGNYDTCTITAKAAITNYNLIFKHKNNTTNFVEVTVNNETVIPITLNEWESTWILPSMVDSNNNVISEGILNRNIDWTSSDSNIAFIIPLYDMAIFWTDSVPETYDCHPIKVFGLSAGTTYITATASNGVVKTFKITVNPTTNKYINHSFVDLGILGVNFATQNLGAVDYSECGYRYAWGEIAQKNQYTQSNYLYKENSSKPAYIGTDIIQTQYDAVYNDSEWGNDWRMPSRKDMVQLSSLSSAHVKIGNNKYMLKMGLNNDNYILCYEYGFINSTSIKHPEYCFYWTGQGLKQSSADYTWNTAYAWCTRYGFQDFVSFINSSNSNRFNISCGLPIRPVFSVPITGTRDMMVNSNIDTDIIDNENNENDGDRPTASYIINDLNYNGWSQFYPDAIFSPIFTFSYIDYSNNSARYQVGYHFSLGGCTNHSRCQVMSYYKWPIYKNIKGNIPYPSSILTQTEADEYISGWNRINPTSRQDVNNNKNYYTLNSKQRYDYSKILKKYITSSLIKSDLAYLISDGSTTQYADDWKHRCKGVQYSYAEATEFAYLLLDFAKLNSTIKWGPHSTGARTDRAHTVLRKYYQYNRKEFALSRTNLSKDVFENILQDTLSNNIPVPTESSNHAWLITGYKHNDGEDNSYYYINLNEGNINQAAYGIDSIVSGKNYSKGLIATIGTTPICMKSIRDYFIMYLISVVRKQNASNQTSINIKSYFNNINGNIYIDNMPNNTTNILSFNKSDNNALTVTIPLLFHGGNAVPEKIYLAVCLENSNNEVVGYIKKGWYTPGMSDRSTGSNGLKTTLNNINVDLSNINIEVGQTYTLTLRYSNDDGKTYTEKLVFPDNNEYQSETVQLIIENNSQNVNDPIIRVNVVYE